MLRSTVVDDNSESSVSLTCNCVQSHEQEGTPAYIIPGRSAYRTSCRHILCEGCASRAFTTGSLCPVCNTRLHDGQVQELMIGVPPNDVSSSLYQTAFQNPNWNAILDNTYQAVSAAYDLQLFVQNQLMYELVIHKERGLQQEKRLTQLSDEQNKTSLHLKTTLSENSKRIKDLEYHIQMRENELCEIKDAYKEKLRKCEAWEKAYNSLSQQQHRYEGFSDSNNSYPPNIAFSSKSPLTLMTRNISQSNPVGKSSLLHPDEASNYCPMQNNFRGPECRQRASHTTFTNRRHNADTMSHKIPPDSNKMVAEYDSVNQTGVLTNAFPESHVVAYHNHPKPVHYDLACSKMEAIQPTISSGFTVSQNTSLLSKRDFNTSSTLNGINTYANRGTSDDVRKKNLKGTTSSRFFNKSEEVKTTQKFFTKT